ncbi:MAG: signal peptidase I [Chloroflexi bacterium]|nr:signal peptidase I [Chloroflexota bacterium]
MTEPEAPYIENAPPPAETPPSPSLGRRLFRALRDVLETIVPAVVIALLINLLLAQATRVYGHSMVPNLETDQRLVVEKLSYRFREPQRGDVVVIRLPQHSQELLIKRVIALPGERVSIHDGQVHINGSPLAEPYLAQKTRGYMEEQAVPAESIFVLGDNRGASNDSRSFGMLPYESIVGRAWVSYWPPERAGFVR